jgi:hypothetical protein
MQTSRQRNRPRTTKAKKTKRNHQPLEVLDLDIQGPFPLPDLEGMRFNFKIVDKETDFVVTIPIADISATTITRHFRRTLAKLG